MKAIDLHVHLPTEEWLQQSIGPHLEATEAYFRARVPRKTIDDVAEEYRARDILGVDDPWRALDHGAGTLALAVAVSRAHWHHPRLQPVVR